MIELAITACFGLGLVGGFVVGRYRQATNDLANQTHPTHRTNLRNFVADHSKIGIRSGRVNYDQVVAACAFFGDWEDQHIDTGHPSDVLRSVAHSQSDALGAEGVDHESFDAHRRYMDAEEPNT